MSSVLARQNLVTIITAIIGSSLLVSVGTSLFSILNQPNLTLNLLFNLTRNDLRDSQPQISYYELLVKNDGMAEATNVTLSMFFVGKNATAEPVLYSGDVPKMNYNESVVNRNLSLIKAYMPKLSEDAMIILKIPINSSIGDSYYISATYDQGSEDITSINPTDIQSGIFPDIRAAYSNIGSDYRILAVSAVAAAICLAITVARIMGRMKNPKQILFNYPIAVLGSIIVLVLIEELVLLRPLWSPGISPSLIIPPFDIACLDIQDKIYCLDGRIYPSKEASFYTAIIYIVIFLARSIVAYLVTRLVIIITKSRPHERSKNIKESKLPLEYNTREFKLLLFAFSFLIMGLPIEATIRYYAGEWLLVHYSSSFFLFMIMLAVEVIRMGFLALYIPDFVKNRVSPWILKMHWEITVIEVMLLNCGILFVLGGIVMALNGAPFSNIPTLLVGNSFNLLLGTTIVFGAANLVVILTLFNRQHGRPISILLSCIVIALGIALIIANDYFALLNVIFGLLALYYSIKAWPEVRISDVRFFPGGRGFTIEGRVITNGSEEIRNVKVNVSKDDEGKTP